MTTFNFFKRVTYSKDQAVATLLEIAEKIAEQRNLVPASNKIHHNIDLDPTPRNRRPKA